MSETNSISISPTYEQMTLMDVLLVIGTHLRLIVFSSLALGLLALAATFAMKPVFTARTLIIPPQQQQSATASALASLGSIAGIAGAAANIKSPAEQYVSLMQSQTVADRIIDRFQMMTVYGVNLRLDARSILSNNTSFNVGKKDGLIAIEVSDTDPQRAADIANQYVEELRRLTSSLALTEPQQRRAFFEQQLTAARDRLTKAQEALQASGFNIGALKAEPRAAAEAFARQRAELFGAEVRLKVLSQRLNETTPEVQQQREVVDSLRRRLSEVGPNQPAESGPDYINVYREYKYQENLFELFSKQFEIAKLDEGREGALIQVVDKALAAEKKSRPKRGQTAIVVTLLSLLLLTVAVTLRHLWQNAGAHPINGPKVERVRQAWRAALGVRRKS